MYIKPQNPLACKGSRVIKSFHVIIFSFHQVVQVIPTLLVRNGRVQIVVGVSKYFFNFLSFFDIVNQQVIL